MNRPIEDIGALMQRYMANAAICTASVMMMELIFAVVAEAREQLRGALGHEPTREDWQDYWRFLGELAAIQKSGRRAEDRERIRRLVMGNTDAA